MTTLAIALTIVLSLGFPYLSLRWYQRPGFPHWLSPVVMCYAIGILISNITLLLVPKETGAALYEAVEPVANQLAAVGMILALPLLLFGARIKQSWRLAAGSGLLSFGLCAVAGLAATALVAFLFRNQQEDGWIVAGMLTGLYTGGTPNLQAIGLALEAPPNYVVLLQSADIIGGGVYLLLLMTVIHPFLGAFLPSFKANGLEVDPHHEQPQGPRVTYQAILLSIGIGALAMGLTWLLTGGISNSTLIIVLLTTISLGVSLNGQVASWRNTYDQGEYFVLIFCVALGLLANFQEIIGDGLPLLTFSLIALVTTILLHWLLAWLFRIDRDTVMVSSTAALYGPVFIAQVTTAIPNRSLLAPGIALSLLGLAVGNYLGIGIAYLAQYLFW
ncbi:MAG: DUF819 family protein [Lewinella sp.]|nr:DUF819 family protein [Lewinella sp.]